MRHAEDATAQVIVSLLKQHGVRQIVASPGNTCFTAVITLQNDPFFTVYSCVDERAAAYMACGMAASSREPVAIACTGATASRNYPSGLTEAFYRKLPVIAITYFNNSRAIGQMLPQCIDRTQIQNDIALKSVDVPIVRTKQDREYATRIVNDALLETQRHGGGPVHINVSTDYGNIEFSDGAIEQARVIRRYSYEDKFPEIGPNERIAVFIGAHLKFDERTYAALERFAKTHNVVVLYDHTSNYQGEYGVLSTLVADNHIPDQVPSPELEPSLVIDLGEVSGDYPTTGFLAGCGARVWRVAPDGEIRDRFHALTDVFECSEAFFFERYAHEERQTKHELLDAWRREDEHIRKQMPELPLSNRWISQQVSKSIPAGSVVHFAILNSLRSWNYWSYDKSVLGFSNTGGFGIDGAISTALGSALALPDKMHVLCVGDLAFFYDMNTLGCREMAPNIRILLVNNGVGVEFHMGYSPASVIEDQVDDFVAAGGHFASKKPGVSAAQAWAEVMGLGYMKANTKAEVLERIPEFLNPDVNKPVVFECFTAVEGEKAAADMLRELGPMPSAKKQAKDFVKRAIPKEAFEAMKYLKNRA